MRYIRYIFVNPFRPEKVHLDSNADAYSMTGIRPTIAALEKMLAGKDQVEYRIVDFEQITNYNRTYILRHMSKLDTLFGLSEDDLSKQQNALVVKRLSPSRIISDIILDPKNIETYNNYRSKNSKWRSKKELPEACLFIREDDPFFNFKLTIKSHKEDSTSLSNAYNSSLYKKILSDVDLLVKELDFNHDLSII